MVQWLGLGALTAVAQVQPVVRELIPTSLVPRRAKKEEKILPN